MGDRWIYSSFAAPPNSTFNSFNSTEYQSWTNPSLLVPPYPPPPRPQPSVPPPTFNHPPPMCTRPPSMFTQPPPVVHPPLPSSNFPQNYQSHGCYVQNEHISNSYQGYCNSYQNYENCSYNSTPPGCSYNNYVDNSYPNHQHTQDFRALDNSSRNGNVAYNYKDELESYKNLQDNFTRVIERQSVSPEHKYRYERKRDDSRKSNSPVRSRPNRRRSRSRSKSSRSSRYHSRGRERSPEKSVRSASIVDKSKSERDLILSKWRKNYCTTKEEVCNKIKELSKISQDEILAQEKNIWTRTTPANLYYEKDEKNQNVVHATPKLLKVCKQFEKTLVLRAQMINEKKPKYEPPPRKNRARLCKHKSEETSTSGSSEEELTDEEDCSMEELTRKQQHPDRLHPEMWYNDPGEMNDGPLCRCSKKARKCGIRHGIYAGERFLQRCDKTSNNADKLYHYRITISPPTNFLIKTPTIIQHDEHEFIFEGFSMLSHFPLIKLPTCKVIRFNIEYSILYIEEKIPENFTVLELDHFYNYLFKEVLELVDLDFKAAGDGTGCSQFHFMPRFVRELPDNGKEILSMKEVLQYFLDSAVPLIGKDQLEDMVKMSQYEWQSYADAIKGMVVTYPGQKPCSVRVDQLDRNNDLQEVGNYKFPEIVHFGIRPPQLSYAGNPDYQKAWRDYVKFRHLLANMSKPTFEDKRKLETKENKLQEMRTQSKMKRDVTVAVSAQGFYRTGIMCDIVQHAMLIPVLVCHLRFHNSLSILEETINYKFQNRALLQLALTHPSYRENFGTNPDHARNSLTNCGIRQPEYGDRRIHYMNTRKRGINTLINIMSRFGKKQETESNITHNERLEFLGDAVVEFLSSIHLFYSFPDLEEGGLATYRAAIVQNQHLAVLARTLNLDQYMLYAHGSDLCHDLELRHAMANCFEALMGALFLDGGIEVADRVFSDTLFKENADLFDVWMRLPPHPLQEQEPTGDRNWIPKFELLQKLTKFEEQIGVDFTHIRLLARAFTDRSVGFTNLTLGSNQRLEFLGDTVLQLIASDYLYKYFPEHHEGHLSLLRSSLVNNRTQAVVCDDLGMADYAVYNNPKAELKTKDRADLLEAFIGALYVDKGLEYCEVFCQVTLFPRLQDFIMNQDWNDPKSKLQQCCLTLRTMDGGEPDIPVYKVIECKGPTNTRVYTVAVYFRGKRLASAMGHSIQQAEMNAAKKALEISHDLFPQLDHQKRVIAKSMKKQTKNPHRHLMYHNRNHSHSRSRSQSRKRLRSRSQSLERYSRRKTHRSRSRSSSRTTAASIYNNQNSVETLNDCAADKSSQRHLRRKKHCSRSQSRSNSPAFNKQNETSYNTATGKYDKRERYLKRRNHYSRPRSRSSSPSCITSTCNKQRSNETSDFTTDKSSHKEKHLKRKKYRSRSKSRSRTSISITTLNNKTSNKTRRHCFRSRSRSNSSPSIAANAFNNRNSDETFKDSAVDKCSEEENYSKRNNYSRPRSRSCSLVTGANAFNKQNSDETSDDSATDKSSHKYSSFTQNMSSSSLTTTS